jgi:2-dehydropantoate 2-reductase
LRVLVFGAGAVGSYLGGMLATQNLVTLVGRHDHMDRIKRDGLHISGLKDVFVRPSTYVEVPADERYDVVLIAVKSYDLDEALKAVHPVLGGETALIVVQNGLEMATMPERVADSKVCLGVASFGVTYVSPGEVRYAGEGPLRLGARGEEGDVHPLVRMFQASGVGSEASTDIAREAWRKAVINSAINPITALVRRPNGHILGSAELRALCQCLFEESMGIAVECGELPPGDLTFEDVERTIVATSGNRSSMLQDVERGRRTEVDAINGTFLARGRALGLSVIYNNTVIALIHGMELSEYAR